MIIKSTGGLYHVEALLGSCSAAGQSEAIVECRAKGAFRHDGVTPLAGDRVVFEQQENGSGLITEILPRTNRLVRPAAANIGLLILVCATKKPEPDLYLLDKLAASACLNDIEPLFVFNKADIAPSDSLLHIYRTAGFGAIALSALHPDLYCQELAWIQSRMEQKISFVAGVSGAGKTSLIHALCPQLTLKTGELSRKTERGRHTTRCTMLYRIHDGTYLADTPGFSLVDLTALGNLTRENLLTAFPDLLHFADGCKYSDCTHLREEGCAVIDAIHRDIISPSRHVSYCRLYEELGGKNPWDA